MEVEGGDAIKDLTRLSWSTPSRLVYCLAFQQTLSVCVLECPRDECFSDKVLNWFVYGATGCSYTAADVDAAAQ